jgi:putative ABC transport system permease protein
MKALDRKLLRDLKALWSQVLTIALVVASGVGGFLTTLSAVDSLAAARERFYASERFADVFASLKRAPLALAERLREIEGVADVQPTVEFVVRLQAPDHKRGDGHLSQDPVLGQLIGLDARAPRRLNRLVLRRGLSEHARAPHPGGERPDGALPVFVSEAFADSWGLAPGARLSALVNGRERTLVIAGVALSPEYIFAGLFGMPDPRSFGVFWIDAQALAGAYDMAGAFNRVALALAPRADERAVTAAVQRLLEPYGARDAHGREHQMSHRMVDNEIKEQQVMGTMLPVIFLGVAAFLLNVVITRLVATQREQIAALKALGYRNRAIGAHYLMLVMAIVALGYAIGVLLGREFGLALLRLYAEFFRLPSFDHRLAPELLATAAALTLVTAVGGTLNAIAATVRLAPAEAMRPPAPGIYRPSAFERWPWLPLTTTLRMILRQLERRPWRSALSVAGVSAAVAIVVLGNFFRDAIDVIVDTQFNVVLRSDVSVWLADSGGDDVRRAVAQLPGATQVQAVRDVPVRLVHGHRIERLALRGLDPEPPLLRVVDVDLNITTLPESGVVLTDRLAAKLGVAVGGTVLAEVLEGRARTVPLTVVATVREMMGLAAYMRRDALNRALGDGDLASTYSIAVPRGEEGLLLAAMREAPRVAGAFSKSTMLRNMEDISARNVRIMSTVFTFFACVIAVGVVYNNARIALAERTWELASLRVLGFTRAEVSALLLGELALVIVVALPLGMLAGFGLVHALIGALASDQFLFPVVIQPRTYAMAAIVVVLAGVASALVVRRRVDRLDMVAALKTRE